MADEQDDPERRDCPHCGRALKRFAANWLTEAKRSRDVVYVCREHGFFGVDDDGNTCWLMPPPQV